MGLVARIHLYSLSLSFSVSVKHTHRDIHTLMGIDSWFGITQNPDFLLDVHAFAVFRFAFS